MKNAYEISYTSYSHYIDQDGENRYPREEHVETFVGTFDEMKHLVNSIGGEKFIDRVNFRVLNDVVIDESNGGKVFAIGDEFSWVGLYSTVFHFVVESRDEKYVTFRSERRSSEDGHVIVHNVTYDICKDEFGNERVLLPADVDYDYWQVANSDPAVEEESDETYLLRWIDQEGNLQESCFDSYEDAEIEGEYLLANVSDFVDIVKKADGYVCDKIVSAEKEIKKENDEEYVIMYDYSTEYDDYYDQKETFRGNWNELQKLIDVMRDDGCYNIEATCVSGCGF